MSIKLMNQAWEVKGLDPTAKLVLMCLADHANEDDRTCWPAMATIARKCDVSARTVQRHMRALEERGLIALRKQRQGDSNLYFILPSMADGTERGDKLTGVTPVTRPMTPVTRTPDTGVTQTIRTTNKPSLKVVQSADAELATSLYNAVASTLDLPQVQKLTETRRRKLVQRLKDCGGIEGWQCALDEIGQSPFLTGQNNRGWKADFDFLLQEKSFTRLMEGAYRQAKSQREQDFEFLKTYAMGPDA